jgi:predicted XRE-type DNA-binding protein
MSTISRTNKGFTNYRDWRAAQNFDPEEIARGVQQLYKEILQYKLKELRLEQGLTQKQLADKLGVTQNRISKFERLDLEKAELRTIRSYIEALGGEVSIVVTIDDQPYKLNESGQSS